MKKLLCLCIVLVSGCPGDLYAAQNVQTVTLDSASSQYIISSISEGVEHAFSEMKENQVTKAEFDGAVKGLDERITHLSEHLSGLWYFGYGIILAILGATGLLLTNIWKYGHVHPLTVRNRIDMVDSSNMLDINGFRFFAATNATFLSTLAPCPPLALAALPMALRNPSCVSNRVPSSRTAHGISMSLISSIPACVALGSSSFMWYPQRPGEVSGRIDRRVPTCLNARSPPVECNKRS